MNENLVEATPTARDSMMRLVADCLNEMPSTEAEYNFGAVNIVVQGRIFYHITIQRDGNAVRDHGEEV